MRLATGLLLAALLHAQAPSAPLHAVRVQILSTMLADNTGYGEWGFSALIEADGRRILFDTGAHPDTVLRNARELKVDLSHVTDVILTHNHLDHTAGLVTLRREFSRNNPAALSRVHVARGIFFSRPGAGGRETNSTIRIKTDYEAAGGEFIEHTRPAEIFPGAWLTGPVPRRHPERNWSQTGLVRGPDGSTTEDNVPEDQSLVLETGKGLVLISGCGHAGMINTLEHVRTSIRPGRYYAVIGGFHLFGASDSQLEWTAGKLKEFGVGTFVGAHCTGIEPVYRFRQLLGLDRAHCVVGAVGAVYRLDGMEPGNIAR